MTKPRVVVVRGHHANPWDLRPWEDLADRYDIVYVVTGSNLHDLRGVDLASVRIRALSDFVVPRRARAFWAGAPFNRYLGLERALEGAAIVHAAELGTWYTAAAAKLKDRLGFRLVLTVWETIPFRDTYRPWPTRANRRATLAAADLYLAVTDRARAALDLEGVPATKVVVSPPGIDLTRFSAPAATPREHLVISPGRLVWEKGHQDVLRALAALGRDDVRLLVVGSGPEESRLRAYAAELGLGGMVELKATVPYGEMPDLYGRASAMVLASLPTRNWEEQFGMVLAEAMAAGLPIVASSSGAIPEVVGQEGRYFAPGDWLGLARELAAGPLADPPGTRVGYSAERLERFSSAAAAQRLAEVYERVLGR